MVYILAFLLSLSSYAEVKIAVVDSGYSESTIDVPLCKEGHFDFITRKPVVGIDTLPHGTNIAQTINAQITSVKYCLIILRVFNQFRKAEVNAALNYAQHLDIQAINMSFYGDSPSLEEFKYLKYITQVKKVAAFASAGNKGQDLGKNCNAFPACYVLPINVVAAVDYNGVYMPFSNYGYMVKVKEYGCSFGMCGTSQASAIAVGKYIQKIYGGK